MVLLIDNYDSFTYNLYQQVAALGYEVAVKKHDEVTIDQIAAMSPSHIIISPGPKRPEDSGISMEAIGEFYTKVPILGVCLGHQCIAQFFGSGIIGAPRIMHGKTDLIRHEGLGIFAEVPNPFTAARYNSLVIDAVSDELQPTAWSDDGTIQAIQHPDYPLFGVQFHPESFMSEHGEKIMRNFLQCST